MATNQNTCQTGQQVETDKGRVWKRHANQMTSTGIEDGIVDEPVSMAVEPEWMLVK